VTRPPLAGLRIEVAGAREEGAGGLSLTAYIAVEQSEAFGQVGR